MRRLFLMIAFIGMFLGVFAMTVQAELCAKCKQNSIHGVVTPGICKACQGPTSSALYAICSKCSAKNSQCEHCLAALGPVNPYAKPKPGQIPHLPGKPGKLPPTQVDPGKLPPTQVTPSKLPPAQVDPGKLPPTQVDPGKLQPTQGVAGQVPNVPFNDPAKPVVITEANNGQTIALRQPLPPAIGGQTLVLQLPGNPTTGYTWELLGFGSKDMPWKSNPQLDAVLVQSGEKQFVQNPAAQGMVGVGGTFTFTFQAVGPGKRDIALEYVRPWNTKEKPAKTFRVTVEVGAGPQINKPGQMIPGQTPPTQVIPGQMPPTQVIPGQTPPTQVIPGQTPPTQVIPGQTPPTQVIPGQTPPTQVIPGQTPPTQVIPGQTPPTQVNPGQKPPTQIIPGQTPPVQGTPGQVTPPPQGNIGSF